MGGEYVMLKLTRNSYKILSGKPQSKKPLGKPRRRWRDSNEICIKERGFDGVDWIYLVQDRDQ
jgi:hypothetical protein